MRARAVVAGLAFAVPPVSVAVAAQNEPVASKSGARVVVTDNYFDPRSTTIRAGESVKWTWRGHSRHDIVFRKVPSGAARIRVRSRSKGRVRRRFATPGTYRYVCTLYDGMEGKITVKKRGGSLSPRERSGQ